ncbi:MAG: diphosphomevalonate decarboxylase [Desulfobacterales bacterium]
MIASSIAHPNIALVKYWGKSDWSRNLPAVGSISVTLSQLETRTTVEVRRGLQSDRLYINGNTVGPDQTRRMASFLDEIRRIAGTDLCCEVHSRNSFPTAAGLASSASGFAALTLAATRAFGLTLQPKELSALARLGSGSAARSIYGGFVELPAGNDCNRDCAALQIENERFWPISILVAVTSENVKPIGSRDAMAITEIRSPFYGVWIEESQKDIMEMRTAIRRRDIETVGTIAEHSALKLHGMLMAARPGILYWNQGTIGAIQEIIHLRESTIPVYFTIDAGPQVKAICPKSYESIVAERLRATPGVEVVLRSAPGPAASLLET